MSSRPIHIEFGNKTQHQVNTDGLIASLPGDTIREKVIQYVRDVLSPEYQDLNKQITTQEGIYVGDKELDMIRSLRNKLVDITFLQGLEKVQEDKAAISEKLSPMIDSVSTLYSSMLVAYCHTELDALNKLRETLWQEVEGRHFDISHFNRLIDGAKNIEAIAGGISRENLRVEILRECSQLREAYTRITEYNNDYHGRKARHQD